MCLRQAYIINASRAPRVLRILALRVGCEDFSVFCAVGFPAIPQTNCSDCFQGTCAAHFAVWVLMFDVSRELEVVQFERVPMYSKEFERV